MSEQQQAGAATQRLLDLMDRLRDPEHGCRWDLKQTMESLTPHTLEEVHEVIDAVENGSPDDVRDELGDLLFQIVFYARIANENGRFDFAAVADSVFNKLLKRHPHVFPDGTLESFGQNDTGLTPEEVESNWESIKNAERERRSKVPVSVMDDIPSALPAVQRAAKIQGRVASVGFDWSDAGEVLDKLQEELDELRQAVDAGTRSEQAHELGDLLFTCVNLSRHLKVDAEQALRDCNRRFQKRFRYVEAQADATKVGVAASSSETLEAWWREAKEAGE